MIFTVTFMCHVPTYAERAAQVWVDTVFLLYNNWWISININFSVDPIILQVLTYYRRYKSWYFTIIKIKSVPLYFIRSRT